MDFSNHRLNKHNVNVNEAKVLNNNDNVNNDIVAKANRTESQVNLVAERLVETFDNRSGWLFYCKVGWKLSEAQIANNIEIARNRGRNPKQYFSWLCKRDLTKLG